SQVLDVAVAFFFDAVFVEVELDVQLNANGFQCRLRSRLRHRLGCSSNDRSRSRLAATAEVQTNTHAGLPLGVALVDVVQSVNAGTGVEHFGEVVLGTSASDSQGGVVTTTAVGVADALMAEAGRNVRTQANTRLTEVVDGLQVGQVAFDVLAAGSAFKIGRASCRERRDTQGE